MSFMASMGRMRVIAAVAALFFVTGCASIGLNRQGNQFNYENASKLKKGMTMAQVEALLEGKPRATGRQMHTGYTHWHYEYVQSSGLGVGIPYIGASGSKGQGYTCDVYFTEAGKVADFNYFTNEIGGEGVSF
ncbi:MAG: outer membrane protein assembly factor BamE [Myxococcota bacterium]|nr:outer membrane protein assembly factor BamE [Myxococcota bacterium]